MGCSPSSPADTANNSEDDNTQEKVGRYTKQRKGGKSKEIQSFQNQSKEELPLPLTTTASSTNIVVNSSIEGSSTRYKMMDHQRYSNKEGSALRLGSSGANFIRLGPMTIFRPTPVKVSLVFPKEDSLFNGIMSGCDRFGWETGVRLNSIQDQLSYLPHDPFAIDILLLDYRQPKTLPQNTLSTIRFLKDDNPTLVVVAFVKKSSLDKCEDAISTLHENGVDWVEVESGQTSGAYWHYQLAQYERCFIIPALKLATTKPLLVALDHCKDMIQITDSSHRIQFVNRAYERLMGYSCEEISGCDFHELQGRGGGLGNFSLTEDQIQAQQQQQNRNDSSPLIATSGAVSASGDRASPVGGQSQSQSQPPNPVQQDHLMADISQGKEWEGSIMYNPKTGEPIFLHSKVLPFNVNLNLQSSTASTSNIVNPNYASSPTSDVHGGSNVRTSRLSHSTHYIYVSDVPTSYHEKSYSSDAVSQSQDVGCYNILPRGSLKSLRKASYDIKSISNDSSILRRQSLAKLHSLTIEAPITKVINIIAAAQQNCPLYIAQALEKVLEILRTTELYSPQFFDQGKIKSDDPLTTDLLGALLQQGARLTTTARRSSNENRSSLLAPRPSLPDIAESPSTLQRLLETEESWSFDVIFLEEITEKRPLVFLGMTIFARFGVAQVLQTDEDTLRNWLTLIEANYHSTNSYHNSTHAADVLQATAYFLSTERLKGFLEPLDEVISLIAAVVHDVDHPGKTSPFLINSGNDLALLYNDLSVLESHHAAFSFKLTFSDPRVNIFQNFQYLEPETFKGLRQSLIDMVLATEMNKHFEHLSKFVNVFTKPFLREDSAGPSDHTPVTPTEPDISTLITTENVVLVKRMLIKCADVGNPTRPLKLCVEWAGRIAEEYYRQTEEELARGLPPVMPMFDRSSCSIPKSQTGFVDYFVADMYEAWDAFLDVPEVIEHMKYNYDYWKEQDRQGFKHAILDEDYVQKNPQPLRYQPMENMLRPSDQSQL